jgi:hypothetical protein
MSYTIEACVLCGSDTEPRVMALIEWTEPIGRDLWAHVPRCVDRAACRYRVELVLGEPWPVNDGTPAPVKPVTAPEPPAPVVEEEISWLR